MIVRRASDLPTWYNAVEILESNLASRSDCPALVTDERTWTFAEVSIEVNRVGNALRELGVRPDERVAILCPDTAEWVFTFFACLKIGAVAVGMNTLLTPRELRHIFLDSGARVLIVHASLSGVAREARSDEDRIEHTIVVGDPADASGDTDHSSDGLTSDGPTRDGLTGPRPFADLVRGASTDLIATRTHRDDFGTLNYSSGTTGEPKGILHAHRDYALTAQLWGVDVLGLVPEDRTFSVAKLFFTFGLGGNLLFPWRVGASVVLYPGSPRQARDVLAVIERHRPTILFNAPTGYASMLAIEDFPDHFGIDSLRLGVSAGEALPAPVWQGFRDRTGIELIDGIGSTENFHIFISNRPGDIRPGSSGKPVPGYECRIVDADGIPLPEGEVGTLHIRGETAALSYLHDAERSRSTFLGPWLDTGDKYYVDEDGYFWHAGRSDDMLKVGGIWVSPVEVESTLIEHEAVVECAVVGVTDAADLVKPKAFVVLNDRFEANDDLAGAIVTHCVERMAAYKRPRWIEFVGELPKTATGKIQRYRLR